MRPHRNPEPVKKSVQGPCPSPRLTQRERELEALSHRERGIEGDFPGPDPRSDVGWVERSDTHRQASASVAGIGAQRLNPPYEKSNGFLYSFRMRVRARGG